MSASKRFTLPPFHQFCVEVAKVGRVPKHIAFIMDGNRRFIQKHSLEALTGLSLGFNAFQRIMEWCYLLGVEEITMFVFSIENFKRTKEQVAALMDLIRTKFLGFLSEIDLLNKHGVRLKVVGRRSLLSDDLLTIIDEMESATRNNTKLIVNFGLAYTGRDEISRAASCIIKKVQNGELSPEDVDEHLVSQTLELSEPELLVRTSGELRLSDFMQWQVSHTVLYFTKALWPEITFWNLLAAIVHFQRHAPTHCNRRNVA